MDSKIKTRLIVIIALLVMLCIWTVFLMVQYPSIKEGMMTDMAKWKNCGIGMVK